MAGILGLAGCAEERSYAVITVRTTEGELTNIAQFLVRVWNGPDRRDRLFYPRGLTGRYRITSTETVDFSVSFSTSLSGTLRVGVQPLDVDARSLGYGELERPIDPGHTIRLTVSVTRGAPAPPDDDRDAGARPDGLGDSRSVCDPTGPATCGAGRTCNVGCFGHRSGRAVHGEWGAQGRAKPAPTIPSANREPSAWVLAAAVSACATAGAMAIVEVAGATAPSPARPSPAASASVHRHVTRGRAPPVAAPRDRAVSSSLATW